MSFRLSSDVEQLVHLIRDSDMFGTFVETGGGCPVASSMYAVSGASKTVFASLQPYNKSYANSLFNNEGLRAVSSDNVLEMIQIVSKNAQFHDPEDVNRCNTIYVSSFQLGELESKVRTHGWIGIRYKTNCRLFHLSMHDPSLDRQAHINLIGHIGLQLLVFMMHPENTLIPPPVLCNSNNVHVDIVHKATVDLHSSSLDASLALQFMMHASSSSSSSSADAGSTSCCVFDPTGAMVRLENWCRDREHIVLFKGSFNPITVEHVRLFTEAMTFVVSTAQQSQQDKKQDSKKQDVCGAFMISINTVDKGQVSIHQLLQRVSEINHLGYYCIINATGRFKTVLDFFQQSFPDSQVHLPVGADTWDRIEVELKLKYPQTFIVSERTQCSSTEVRAILQIPIGERTLEQHTRLKALVPSK